MNIDFTSRPWNEFISLVKEGQLAEENEYYDKEEGEAFEERCFSFCEMTGCDSYIFYTEVMYMNHCILKNDLTGKNAFKKFNDALFNEEYPIDIEGFEEINECVVGLFSSERVRDLAALTKQFDIKEIENIHIQSAEEEGYIDYLTSMIELINKAADNDHGLEIFMG